MNKALKIAGVITIIIVILILQAKFGCEQVDCNANPHPYQYNRYIQSSPLYHVQNN